MRTRYFFVLASLAGGPKLSQQDLSRLLNLDPTTVAIVLDEMERNRPFVPGKYVTTGVGYGLGFIGGQVGAVARLGIGQAGNDAAAQHRCRGCVIY